MSELPAFEVFESIPRLVRACVISEKIDGTNAQVFIPDDLSGVFAGSRNRWITPEADNHGFARWVADNATELLKLGPGRHYGEWWGSGIQRRYGMTEKRFSLFNSGRWTDDVLRDLALTGSKASPGFMNPEGVVVYLAAARKLFKKTIGDDGHKGEAFRKQAATQKGTTKHEQRSEATGEAGSRERPVLENERQSVGYRRSSRHITDAVVPVTRTFVHHAACPLHQSRLGLHIDADDERQLRLPRRPLPLSCLGWWGERLECVVAARPAA